jgi:chromosome partitioning protein
MNPLLDDGNAGDGHQKTTDGHPQTPYGGPQAPYVIAVCHQKGGVAKTTTVSVLATIFAMQGHPTLAVDLDPTGNLTASFGLNAARARRSIADILLGNIPLSGVCTSTQLECLDVIPSNGELSIASRFLPRRPNYEYLLRTSLLQSGPAGYRFILLDCPPSVAALTTTALTAANLAIIPIQCEFYSLQALDAMFKTIQQVRASTNPGLCYRLLVVMYDQRGSLHMRVLELLRGRYAHILFNTVIGFDSKLRESQLAGIPVPLFSPRSRAAQQYQTLAKELYAYVENQTLPESA